MKDNRDGREGSLLFGKKQNNTLILSVFLFE